LSRERAYAFDDNGMVLLRTMREVQTGNIHSGSYQLFEPLLAVRGRSYGADDLGPSHMKNTSQKLS
jgi:hypothetical protein